MKQRIPRTPASDRECRLLNRLSRCRFAVASWDKRFVRNVAAEAPGLGLTERQRAVLAKLEHRYRRQLAGLGWAEGRP